MRDGAKIFARRASWGFDVDLLMARETPEGLRGLQGPSSLELLPVGQIPRPLVSLKMNQAQALMDQLWECGLRPTEGTGSAGAMAAVQNHLADMRALAAKALGTPLPPVLRTVSHG